MIETIKTCFAEKQEVAAVYLFGSFASGKNRVMSDVDIAVLLYPEDRFIKSAHIFRQAYISQLGRSLRKDIHPVILNHAGEVLLKQILFKGKPVLVKDETYHKQFKMVALARIVDFNFHLKTMQSKLKKRILEVQ
ncbi:MAG: nucleotidyltransferase domain-containing protein [Desulfobacteraceae bacterium]